MIYNGYDEMFVGGMAMGADGAIGTTFNVMGRLFVRIFEALKAGDMERRAGPAVARQCGHRRADRRGVFPGTKAMLKILGVDCGPCRRPFAPLTPAQQARVEAIVASHLADQ